MIDFACKKFDLEEIIRCSLSFTKTEFEIVKFLIEHNKREFTSLDLAKKLKLGLSTVQKTIKKMNDLDIVERNQKNLLKGGYVFVYRIKHKSVIQRKILSIIHNWVLKVESEMKKW